MKRILIVALLVIAVGAGCAHTKEIPMSKECRHEWVQGPFYLKAAVSYEEPQYYPPNGMVKVEHCTKCGALRLPENLRKYNGVNMSAGEIK